MFKLELINQVFISLPADRPSEWKTHMMAPAAMPIIVNNEIEIFIGGWDERGISSIYSIKVNTDTLTYICGSAHLRLAPGKPGNFDENGVFPASIITDGPDWKLSYTGFQLGHQIPHYNFGGLASPNRQNHLLDRLSMAPFLDRADEGLSVRAGLTAVNSGSEREPKWMSVYAAGSSFEKINGKLRPNYNIFKQNCSPYELTDSGELLLSCLDSEHGVGRPYLQIYGEYILLFYTRRMRNFSYLPGLCVSTDAGSTFNRVDSLLLNLSPRMSGIDDEMQYFPSPLIHDKKLYVFFNGNEFGKKGMGIWVFRIC
jgi:hypothetical protein